MRYYIPIAVILALHVVFLLLDAYSIPILDSVMHLAGGVALALLIYGVLACVVSRGWCADPGMPLTPVLIVSLVATGAVCWEFYEWISDTVFGTRLQLTVGDTMKDLFLGLLGGTLCAAYVVLVYSTDKRGLATRSACKPVRTDA